MYLPIKACENIKNKTFKKIHPSLKQKNPTVVFPAKKVLKYIG